MNGTILPPDTLLARYTNDTEPPYHCKKCNRPFAKIMGVKMHFVRSHTNKNWDSSGNFRPNASANGPNQQRVAKKRTGGYQCQYCDHPPFKSDGGLRYHSVATHGITSTGKTGATCPECGYQSSPQGVALHRSLKHGKKGRFSRVELSKARVSQIAAMEAATERKPRTVEQIFGRPEGAQHERRIVRACPHCAQNLDDVREKLGGKKLAFCPVDGVDIEGVEEEINK